MLSGALWRLSLQTNWERDEAHSAKIVAAKWREIWMEVQNMGCCNGGATQSIDIQVLQIQTQIYMTQLQALWVAAAFDVQVAFYQVPVDFDTDPGDAPGDEVDARDRALCIICHNWVQESFNTGMGWIEDSVIGVVSIGVGALAVPIIPIWLIGAGFAAVSLTLSALYEQLASADYRSYMACALYENLKGISTNNEAGFSNAWDSLPPRPPPAETPDQDLARDAIEVWGRAQLNLHGNYLAFVSQLDDAMSAATIYSDEDCPCLADWEHTFDFEIDDQGWTDRAEDDRPYGVYSPGVGWVSVWEAGATPLAEKLYVQIEAATSRTIIRMEAQWVTMGVTAPSSSAAIAVNLADVRQDIEVLAPFPGNTTFSIVWNGSETMDEIETTMVSANGADISTYVLKKVIVNGIGTDPFP
jgi:hypothetical protein